MTHHGFLREAFHFLFLERLLKSAPPHAFALKGGVNLRFFFGSPRYSEDMDLDVSDIPVHVLKETGYRLLNDKALFRALQTHGIAELRINDPHKAKQTETTQRFRLRLVTSAGEELPTKVEFSRRGKEKDEIVSEPIRSEVAQQHHRLSFVCPHYSGKSAVQQKVRALATRPTPQVRDLFDLYILHLGGHVRPEWIHDACTPTEIDAARENIVSFSENDFRDQILDYLLEEERATYGTKKAWNQIHETLLSLLLEHA